MPILPKKKALRRIAGLNIKWQADRDLNPDKQYQKLLCYHYTIGL